MPSRCAIGVALLVTAAAGCRHVSGDYVWVDAYDDAGDANPVYVMARGDLVSVRVLNQESMSARARIRSDGMISLPFVDDIEAAGFEPSALGRRIQRKLKEYVVNPVVTVAVEETAPLEVSVVGEVTRPGVYRIEQDASVLKALASAGGLTTIARRDQIFVLRPRDGRGTAAAPVRIRFTYGGLAQGERPAARFRLRSGDIVVVE